MGRHDDAIHLRGGDWYVVVSPCWFASMSSLSDHQSDWKSRGFPGHIPTSVACLLRRMRFRGGAPAPSPACSGTSCTNSASYGHSGECAISICSRSPDCFLDAMASATERVTDSSGGPESVCRIPMEMSSVQALMDLSLPRFAGGDRWDSSNPSAVVDCV